MKCGDNLVGHLLGPTVPVHAKLSSVGQPDDLRRFGGRTDEDVATTGRERGRRRRGEVEEVRFRSRGVEESRMKRMKMLWEGKIRLVVGGFGWWVVVEMRHVSTVLLLWR